MSLSVIYLPDEYVRLVMILRNPTSDLCLVHFVLPMVKIQGALPSQKNMKSHHAAAGKRI